MQVSLKIQNILHAIYCVAEFRWNKCWRAWGCFTKHDDVIKWKYFPRYWPHKAQWRGTLILSSICAWTNGWANNQESCDLRRHRAHYDVTVMASFHGTSFSQMEMYDIMMWIRSLISNINFSADIEGILPKGPYPPCLRMADRALLARYHWYVTIDKTICEITTLQKLVWGAYHV